MSGSVPASDRVPFSGAVLTGGASRRMGRDKALIDLDGRPLAGRVVGALHEAGATRVICVGGDLDALRRAGLEAVADIHPGDGPLAGVLTALGTPGVEELVAVLATDLLQPDPVAVRRCVDAAVDDVDLVVPVAAGRVQWLHGVWRRSTAGPHVRRAFADGERAVHRAVQGLRVVELDGLAAAATVDADRPEDLTTGDARN
ncbi:molybdenum cofactor guanylyltransferase [Actinomarinicola tropica]|uniref:NTP transferase domain-containing protein n=1 Tax=Actinomarinicola tropica TaxID=2789776 RepID=A0A5Q2RQ51_9ACTN|nr:molybdenum cofactor guanylyltransferase [Actinomarinicola tropica]QGG95335.1 NTP transferase domain-containing protein [Actinomarinicola tropica]